MLLRRYHEAANADAVGASEATPSQAPAADADRDTSTAPAGNASTAEWREYAISRGMDEGTVAEMSRDDIRQALDNLDNDTD